MEKKKNNDKKSLRIILPNFIKSTWKRTFRWRLKITRKKIQHSETMQLLKFICCMLKMWTLNQQALPVRCAHSSVTQPTFFSMSKVCHTKKDWLVFFLPHDTHSAGLFVSIVTRSQRIKTKSCTHIAHSHAQWLWFWHIVVSFAIPQTIYNQFQCMKFANPEWNGFRKRIS